MKDMNANLLPETPSRECQRTPAGGGTNARRRRQDNKTTWVAGRERGATACGEAGRVGDWGKRRELEREWEPERA